MLVLATPTVIILSLVAVANSARILAVYPMPMMSHHKVFRSVTNELLNRGHEVFVITPDPEYSEANIPVNLTEIDVHDVGYKAWREAIAREVTGKPPNAATQFKALISAINDLFVKEMNVEKVKEIIERKKGNFDLLITEVCVRPALGFSHIYQIPHIQISTFGFLYNDGDMGAMTHPLLYPSILSRRIYNLTMWEKIRELWNYWDVKTFYREIEEDEHEKMKKIFGSDVPTLNQLRKRVDLLFLNVHSLWVDNQPLPPNIINVGGLHLKPTKKLQTDLQSYLDSIEHDVIYVSFGSSVVPSTFTQETIEILLGVLAKMPYNVLMKWDKDKLPQQYANIKISKWLPQADLLKHPKVKLFITQGGLQSTDEAIIAGVPLIGIPVFGDQWYNAEKYVFHKIGVKLDLNNFTRKTFKTAIETVLKDKSYRENIIKLRNIIADQPQKPLECAIWWIEYVLRHGGAKHLHPPNANISLYDFLELDLALIILIPFLLILYTCYIIVSFARDFFKQKLVQFKKIKYT